MSGEFAARIEREVAQVIDGKPEQIRTVLTVLLAGGHVLLEDVPGVGKTQLARAFATAIGGSVHRIQFTPDLLPTDITGVTIFDSEHRRFVFHAGPVFSNIVIGDEINRASPKTQSALLECMEEGQVTIDGETHTLPKPFMVIATQNPYDMDGTFVLPEAQRDRFMARLELGYPDEAAEIAMVRNRQRSAPIDSVSPVTDLAEFAQHMQAAAAVHADERVERFAVNIVRATRELPEVRLGASPRSTLQLVRAAKAAAYIDGRDWLSPEDVRELAPLILSHRLVMRDSGAGYGDATEAVHIALAAAMAPRIERAPSSA